MKLWSNKAFAVFWSARTVSFAGTGISAVVLPVLVYRLTNSPAWVAALSVVLRPAYALGFDAASYLLSAMLLLSVRRSLGRPQPAAEPPGRIRADLAEGLRFLWRHPVIRTLTIAVFCVCLSWGGTFGLLAVGGAVGVGLAGWACLGSGALAHVLLAAPASGPPGAFS